MAHFYGILQGSRGEATRCGTKGSGMDTACCSWEGAIRTCAYYNEKKKEDWVRVSFETHHGAGLSKLIYDGPISGREKRVDEE